MRKSLKIVPTIEQIEEIKKLVGQGKTLVEIGKIIGIGKNSLSRIAQENNISFNGFGIGNKKGTAEQYFKEKFESNYENYIYIGGYINCDSLFTMQCKVCGHIQTKGAGPVRRNKTINCSKCEEIEKDKRKVEREILEQKIKEEKAIEKEKARIERLEKLEAEKLAKIRIVECAECGSKFETSKSNIKCCSKECTKKRQNRNKDKRIYKNGKPDLSITLSKLIKRDKNICHICGEKCNGKDFYYIDNFFIAGEDHPSIDHLLPIAKGGEHQWENVKLAHRRCNTEKRDSLVYTAQDNQLIFKV